MALLLLLALAQPEPGPIPPGIVRIGELTISPAAGDAKMALATFVSAHEAHKKGEKASALKSYLAFLGMSGRHELPRRYLKTVKARVDGLRREARAEYDKATKLYRADRAKGLAELERLASRHELLPEGRAARALWHSDRIRVAIETARKNKDKQALEAAVHRYRAALYMYEAKKLLIELGGPDLFDRDEEKKTLKEEEDDEDDEEPTIEVGDG